MKNNTSSENTVIQKASGDEYPLSHAEDSTDVNKDSVLNDSVLNDSELNDETLNDSNNSFTDHLINETDVDELIQNILDNQDSDLLGSHSSIENIDTLNNPEEGDINEMEPSVERDNVEPDSDETDIDDIIQNILDSEDNEIEPLSIDELDTLNPVDEAQPNETDNATEIDLLKSILGEQYQENQSPIKGQKDIELNDSAAYLSQLWGTTDNQLEKKLFKLEMLWDELPSIWPALNKHPDKRIKIEELWTSLKQDKDEHNILSSTDLNHDVFETTLDEINHILAHDLHTGSQEIYPETYKENSYPEQVDEPDADADPNIKEESFLNHSLFESNSSIEQTEPEVNDFESASQDDITGLVDSFNDGLENSDTSLIESILNETDIPVTDLFTESVEEPGFNSNKNEEESLITNLPFETDPSIDMAVSEINDSAPVIQDITTGLVDSFNGGLESPDASLVESILNETDEPVTSTLTEPVEDPIEEPETSTDETSDSVKLLNSILNKTPDSNIEVLPVNETPESIDETEPVLSITGNEAAILSDTEDSGDKLIDLVSNINSETGDFISEAIAEIDIPEEAIAETESNNIISETFLLDLENNQNSNELLHSTEEVDNAIPDSSNFTKFEADTESYSIDTQLKNDEFSSIEDPSSITNRSLENKQKIDEKNYTGMPTPDYTTTLNRSTTPVSINTNARSSRNTATFLALVAGVATISITIWVYMPDSETKTEITNVGIIKKEHFTSSLEQDNDSPESNLTDGDISLQDTADLSQPEPVEIADITTEQALTIYPEPIEYTPESNLIDGDIPLQDTSDLTQPEPVEIADITTEQAVTIYPEPVEYPPENSLTDGDISLRDTADLIQPEPVEIADITTEQALTIYPEPIEYTPESSLTDGDISLQDTADLTKPEPVEIADITTEQALTIYPEPVEYPPESNLSENELSTQIKMDFNAIEKKETVETFNTENDVIISTENRAYYWALNLSSIYKTKKPAEEIVTLLRSKNIPAEIKLVTIEGKTWHRIRIMGFERKQLALDYMAVVQTRTGINKYWISKITPKSTNNE